MRSVFLPERIPGIAYNPKQGVHLRHFQTETLFGNRYQNDRLLDLRPGLVLLRIVCASVCGSGHHFFDNSPTAQTRLIKNLPLGHEMAGLVVAVGAGLNEGEWLDRIVAVESHVPRNFAFWGNRAWHQMLFTTLNP